MRGPILLIFLLTIATGCGKSKSDSKLSSGGDTRPALTKESSTIDVVKDFLNGSGHADVQVDSKEERETKLNKKPAVALHLKWRAKGDTDAKDELFIIQDQRVKDQVSYDTAKSLDENAAMAIQKLEAP